MPKNKTDFFTSLYYSFFSRSFYQSVAREWKGLSLGYLVFILLLFLVPEISRIHSELAESLADEAPKYVRQVPVITIAKGKASIKEQTPFFVYGPSKTIPFAIIDTSGQTPSLNNTGAQFLLTDRQFIIKNSLTESRAFDFADIDKLTIDHQTLYQWIDGFSSLLPFVLFPFALIFSFLYYLIQVLMSAGIGSLLARRLHVALDFKALVRLSVVSFTPAVLLQTVHALLGIPFPYRAPLSFLLALGYLYYALACNSGAKGPVTTATP